MKNKYVTPIYVIGSPRSGTTLIGSYLGSSNKIKNLSEFMGIAFNFTKLPLLYKNVPSKVKKEYIKSIQDHTFWFLEETTIEEGYHYYCDSTPWNIMNIKEMENYNLNRNAIYILMIRDVRGVLKSLEKSSKQGYSWASNEYIENAKLYNQCYRNVKYLPKDRTIILDYDQLCNKPQDTIEKFNNDLKKHEIFFEDLNLKEFTIPHASKESKKRLAFITSSNTIEFNSIKSYDDGYFNDIELNIITKIIGESISEINKLIKDMEGMT